MLTERVFVDEQSLHSVVVVDEPVVGPFDSVVVGIAAVVVAEQVEVEKVVAVQSAIAHSERVVVDDLAEIAVVAVADVVVAMIAALALDDETASVGIEVAAVDVAVTEWL